MKMITNQKQTSVTLRLQKTLLVLLVAAILATCGGQPVQVNLIKSVELSLNNPNPLLGNAFTVHVNGSGTCSKILIDWGDGRTERTGSCADNSNAGSGEKLFQCDVTHTYSGWAGGKTVTAMATKDPGGPGPTTCEGRAMLRFTIPSPPTQIGFVRPGPNVCDPVPNKPDLANHTIVKITTVPISTRCGGIWYDNENPHCYDAEGGAVADSASDPADSRFPFQGMRKFSLVLRVATQLVQGGTNMQFTTTQSGALNLCVNEPDPRAGVGGYTVQISTDELGPP